MRLPHGDASLVGSRGLYAFLVDGPRSGSFIFSTRLAHLILGGKREWTFYAACGVRVEFASAACQAPTPEAGALSDDDVAAIISLRDHPRFQALLAKYADDVEH